MASDFGEEAQKLLEEVQEQREEAAERKVEEEASERLKNAVALTAVILTTALSFIVSVKDNRESARKDAVEAAADAHRESADLWAHYTTQRAEKAVFQLAQDRLRQEAAPRPAAPSGTAAVGPGEAGRLGQILLADYDEHVKELGRDGQQVFYRVQELEEEEDAHRREAIEPARAVEVYEIAEKLLTLSLILLSVTILAGKRWLLWLGLGLGVIGLLVAFDGYFLFV
jgi:hypothetical protein